VEPPSTASTATIAASATSRSVQVETPIASTVWWVPSRSSMATRAVPRANTRNPDGPFSISTS
jgi:hypothetical protein